MIPDAMFTPLAGIDSLASVDGAGPAKTDLPLVVFREMVERRLGRELTDESGRDLASWLESVAEDTTAFPDMTAASTMAHLVVDAARNGVLPVPALPAADVADPGVEVAEPSSATFGSRIAAIARGLGLPFGSSSDNATPPTPKPARQSHPRPNMPLYSLRRLARASSNRLPSACRPTNQRPLPNPTPRGLHLERPGPNPPPLPGHDPS